MKAAKGSYDTQRTRPPRRPIMHRNDYTAAANAVSMPIPSLRQYTCTHSTLHVYIYIYMYIFAYRDVCVEFGKSSRSSVNRIEILQSRFNCNNILNIF